jgi:hypothetical protein
MRILRKITEMLMSASFKMFCKSRNHSLDDSLLVKTGPPYTCFFSPRKQRLANFAQV